MLTYSIFVPSKHSLALLRRKKEKKPDQESLRQRFRSSILSEELSADRNGCDERSMWDLSCYGVSGWGRLHVLSLHPHLYL